MPQLARLRGVRVVARRAGEIDARLARMRPVPRRVRVAVDESDHHVPVGRLLGMAVGAELPDGLLQPEHVLRAVRIVARGAAARRGRAVAIGLLPHRVLDVLVALEARLLDGPCDRVALRTGRGIVAHEAGALPDRTVLFRARDDGFVAGHALRSQQGLFLRLARRFFHRVAPRAARLDVLPMQRSFAEARGVDARNLRAGGDVAVDVDLRAAARIGNGDDVVARLQRDGAVRKGFALVAGNAGFALARDGSGSGGNRGRPGDLRVDADRVPGRLRPFAGGEDDGGEKQGGEEGHRGFSCFAVLSYLRCTWQPGQQEPPVSVFW